MEKGFIKVLVLCLLIFEISDAYNPTLDPSCLDNCLKNCKNKHYDMICDLYCKSLKCSPGSTTYVKKVCIKILFEPYNYFSKTYLKQLFC